MSATAAVPRMVDPDALYPPEARAAEQTLLGAVVVDGDLWPLASARLSEADFYSSFHRRVFAAMARLAAKGEVVNFVTVSDEIDKLTGDEMPRLAQLGHGMGRGMNVESYAAVVARHALRRRLIASLQQAALELADPSVDAPGAAGRCLDAIGRVMASVPDPAPPLVGLQRFVGSQPEQTRWLVDGMIPAGAAGMIAANPKVGKSFIAADLALAVASGGEFLGRRASPGRVAIISREDPPALTAWRLRRLARGRGIEIEPQPLLDGVADDPAARIWVNSSSQTPVFKLTAPGQVASMARALREINPQLVILDVLNCVHDAKENEEDSMKRVLSMASSLAPGPDTAVAVLHHFRKESGSAGSITQQLRGSSAIAGWVQWTIGLAIDQDRRRIAAFELKAARPLDDIPFAIDEEPAARTVRVVPLPPLR